MSKQAAEMMLLLVKSSLSLLSKEQQEAVSAGADQIRQVVKDIDEKFTGLGSTALGIVGLEAQIELEQEVNKPWVK